MAVATAPAQKPEAKNATGTGAVNPFTKAARRTTETFLDVSSSLGTSSKTLAQIDVPATGFLRHVWLLVDVDTPAGATAIDADSPWSMFDNITFRDVNGQPLHVLSGFDLFLANLLGGYTQHADPRKLPGYVASTAGGLHFALRVPIEIISRGALGALPNTNGSMLYKIAITLANRDAAFDGATADAPVRIRGVVESWSNPAAADAKGTPNVTTPPALGVTQNWSEQVSPILVGQNTIRFARVGNAIRNLVFVLRDNAGVRSNAWPAGDVSIFLDGKQWKKSPVAYLQARAAELYGYAPTDIPTGVLVLPFTDDLDGTPGEEVGDFWIETSGATRLELQATFTAAGSLTILTNDVLAVAAPGGAGQTLGA